VHHKPNPLYPGK